MRRQKPSGLLLAQSLSITTVKLQFSTSIGAGVGTLRAHGAISVCFPKLKPQQGSCGTAGLLLGETGHFPGPGVSADALNLALWCYTTELRGSKAKEIVIFLLVV